MLMEMLRRTAKREAGRCALVYRDERLNYQDVLLKTEDLARDLLSSGIQPGDCVALVLPNVPAFVMSFFAIAAIRAIAVPLNPQFKEEELSFYFQHCQIRALITDSQDVRRCKKLISDWDPSVRIMVTGELPSSSGISLPPVSPQDEVLYQYSSGSTGRPKRVGRTQEQCGWEAENFVETTKLTPEDTIFCAVPLFHAHGLGNCLFAAVRSGAKLVLLEEGQPFILKRQRALELLEEEKVTVFPGVPFIFRLLAEAPSEADLSSLRLCFSAGSALPRPVFDAFYEKFRVPVCQLYGCTEAGSVTINLDSNPSLTEDSVGQPMKRVQVNVVNDEGIPLPPGETGEVAISSPALTRGYFEMEELNRQVFRDGFFFTGDVGRLDSEGRLYITGRKKLFIEVAGNKVDPAEIEDVLAAHPKVREAVVVGTKGPVDGEEIIKAVVVPEVSCRERELIEFCHERLANFKIPQIVEFREEIPKSPLGKILRKYLV